MKDYQCQATLVRALGHPVRLQILETLARQPACVCNLTALTGHRQPYVSQHLMVLREAGLVTGTREGWNVRYHLAHPELRDLLEAIRDICSLRSNSGDGHHKRDEGDDNMSANNNVWHGIPRAEINWYPTVVADRCIGCGLCATSCGRGVYAFDYEQNKPVVAAPEMCMVGCTTCATTCPEDAIDFPSRGYIRQLIKQKKVLRQSKDMLRDNREKYDVRLREPSVV